MVEITQYLSRLLSRGAYNSRQHCWPCQPTPTQRASPVPTCHCRNDLQCWCAASSTATPAPVSMSQSKCKQQTATSKLADDGQLQAQLKSAVSGSEHKCPSTAASERLCTQSTERFSSRAAALPHTLAMCEPPTECTRLWLRIHHVRYMTSMCD